MYLETESILEQIEKSESMIPNALKAMSEETSLLKAHMELESLVRKCSLSSVEQEVVILAISVENECDYCIAAHSTASKNINKDNISSLRNRKLLDDQKLQVLRETTEIMIRQNGKLSPQQIDRFKESGYTHSQLLAIVLIIAFKTLTNFSNAINKPDLDDVFVSERWQKIV